MNVSICNVRNYGGMTVYHSAPNASDSIKPRKERMPANRRCMCEIITPCKFFDNIMFFRRPPEHRLNTFRTTCKRSLPIRQKIGGDGNSDC